MSNHKILYVNEKSNDKLKGFVKTRNNLIYNLHCIHPATAEKFTETIVEYQKGTVVSIAGRFICIVTMGLIDKQEGMLIIDLQNDTTKLKENIESLGLSGESEFSYLLMDDLVEFFISSDYKQHKGIVDFVPKGTVKLKYVKEYFNSTTQLGEYVYKNSLDYVNPIYTLNSKYNKTALDNLIKYYE